MIGALPTSIIAPRAPALFYPAPRPMVGTSKLYRPGGLTGGNGLTHCQLAPSEAPFTGGAITIYNNQTVPIVIDAVCVAPTEIANDGYSPIAGGAAGSWTVLSGGPWVVPPAAYIAPGVLGYRPGALKIPFTLASIPRTDISGAPPLLMFRVHVVGQLNASTPATSQLDAQAAAYAARRPWNGFYKAGNFAASNQTGIGAPTRALIGALSVDFVTVVAAKTVLEFGDSTRQGARSTASVAGTSTLHDYNGALMVACDALSTLTRPVYAANCGFQGHTVDQFTNAADVWLAAMSPHVVVGQPWSINDLSNYGGLPEAAFLKSRAILLKAKRSGMVVAWSTAIPSGSTSAGTEAGRVLVNARCRADPDIPCVDYDAAVSDGGGPARLQAAYDSGDGTHPNNAGYAAMAAKLQAFLQGYV